MTINEFEAALDEYGADMALWPIALCTDAYLLLEASSEARERLAATEEIDRAIERHLTSTVRTPADLSDRIVAAAAEMNDVPGPFTKIVAHLTTHHPTVAWGRLIHMDQSTIVGAVALAICFVGGVFTGYVPLPVDTQDASLFVSILYADLMW